MSTFSEPGVIYLNIGREEAEAHLSNAVPGSYVVRPSSRPGNLSLTYRTRDNNNRLGHLLLVQEQPGWMTEGLTGHYRTVRELLQRLPYNLRLQDEQMHAASPSQRPPAPATPGYASVPTAAQMNAANVVPVGAYGRVPQNAVSDNGGYGRAPLPANSNNGGGPTNSVGGDSPYARALPNTNAAAPADYGRVPVAQPVSPYARLQPTSTLPRR
jgi:hypothetical protein